VGERVRLRVDFARRRVDLLVGECDVVAVAVAVHDLEIPNCARVVHLHVVERVGLWCQAQLRLRDELVVAGERWTLPPA